MQKQTSLASCDLGVSTFLWLASMSDSALPLLDKVKAIGFDSVEVALDTPSALNATQVKQRCEDLELGLTVCGVFSVERDFAHPDKRIRQKALSYMAESLDFCASAGATFFAGPMYSAVGKARMIPAAERKAEWDRSVEGISQACEMAGSRGLKLAIEPLNRFETDFLNTTEQAVRYIEDIHHSAAGISLDTFHLNIEEADLEKAILTAGEKLLHLQVADNHRGVPGTGSFNWRSLGSALKTINYRGPIVVESFTTEDTKLAEAVFFWRKFSVSQDRFAEDSLAFLRSWVQQ